MFYDTDIMFQFNLKSHIAETFPTITYG